MFKVPMTYGQVLMTGYLSMICTYRSIGRSIRATFDRRDFSRESTSIETTRTNDFSLQILESNEYMECRYTCDTLICILVTNIGHTRAVREMASRQ